MPEKKQGKLLCVDDLRHAEYYHMQNTFDDLYARSLANETFTDLMGEDPEIRRAFIEQNAKLVTDLDI